MAAVLLPVAPMSSSSSARNRLANHASSSVPRRSSLPSLRLSYRSDSGAGRWKAAGFAAACLPPTPSSAPIASTKLYISGLSFSTTEESLRNAFQNFGQLVEVNLVMDRIANRPRGFAFLRYTAEDEAKKAIEGMHGKFLDGRVIFVEVAKPRSELRQSTKQYPRRY